MYVSPQVEDILGFTQSEWIADPQGWFAQIHPEDQKKVQAALLITRATGEAPMMEYRMLTRDERIVWILDVATVVRDDADQPLRLHGVLCNISAYKEHYTTAAELFAEAACAILKERELDILRLLHAGYFTKQICSELGISDRTVRYRLTNIYSKLNVHSRAEALQRVKELGLFET